MDYKGKLEVSWLHRKQCTSMVYLNITYYKPLQLFTKTFITTTGLELARWTEPKWIEFMVYKRKPEVSWVHRIEQLQCCKIEPRTDNAAGGGETLIGAKHYGKSSIRCFRNTYVCRSCVAICRGIVDPVLQKHLFLSILRFQKYGNCAGNYWKSASR